MADPQEEREQLRAIEASYADKDFARALVLAETLLAVFPASFNGRLLYARTLKALNRQEELEKILGEMHGRYPENTLVLQEMADLYLKQGRYRLAAEQYSRIAFLEPFNRHARDLADKLEKSGQEAAQEPDRFEDTSVEIKLGRVEQEDERLAATAPEIIMDEGLAAALAARKEAVEHEPEQAEPKPREFGLPLEADLFERVEKSPPKEELSVVIADPGAEPAATGAEPEAEPAGFAELFPEIVATTAEPQSPEDSADEALSPAESPESAAFEPEDGPAPEPGHEINLQPSAAEEFQETEDAAFETESQAELFLSQGLVREAAYIYLRLHARTGQERFLQLHRQLLAGPVDQDQARRRVAALEKLLEAFQKRGKQLVQ